MLTVPQTSVIRQKKTNPSNGAFLALTGRQLRLLTFYRGAMAHIEPMQGAEYEQGCVRTLPVCEMAAESAQPWVLHVASLHHHTQSSPSDVPLAGVQALSLSACCRPHKCHRLIPATAAKYA